MGLVLSMEQVLSGIRPMIALEILTPYRQHMFSCVVYKKDRKYKVEYTDGRGLGHGEYFNRLDDLPDNIRDKVKQLMWVSPEDHSLTETLGVRIGENIFWVI